MEHDSRARTGIVFVGAGPPADDFPRSPNRRAAVIAPPALRTEPQVGARIDCELRSEAEVRDAFDEALAVVGSIDQVVYSWFAPEAFERADFAEVGEDRWAQGCERSLDVAWWSARVASPHLRATSGSMVFVLPTVGMAGAAGFAMLATAAEGIRLLAKSCARQWGATGVTVNTVATAPHLWLGADVGEELTKATTLSAPALGGPVTLDHLVPLVHLLTDDGAQVLTASTLVADGGSWMGL